MNGALAPALDGSRMSCPGYTSFEVLLADSDYAALGSKMDLQATIPQAAPQDGGTN
jgi:hypothetical protein